MKKVLCWLCYHIGDTIYKVIDRWDLMAPVFYDLYSWFILKSCDLDEWGYVLVHGLYVSKQVLAQIMYLGNGGRKGI